LRHFALRARPVSARSRRLEDSGGGRGMCFDSNVRVLHSRRAAQSPKRMVVLVILHYETTHCFAIPIVAHSTGVEPTKYRLTRCKLVSSKRVVAPAATPEWHEGGIAARFPFVAVLFGMPADALRQHPRSLLVPSERHARCVLRSPAMPRRASGPKQRTSMTTSMGC